MVEENIKKACSVIDGNYDKRYLDEFFLRLYSFTNENLKAYMNLFKYHGKKVLTTGSSCDQALNLISYRCKDISVFDINPFVKYYYELKKAAILYLDQPKYLDFFHGYREKNSFLTNRIKVLDKETYNKISKYMDEDSKKFWDELFNKYDSLKIKKNLFMIGEEKSRNNIIYNNRYLEHDNYMNLRNEFDKANVKFYHDSLPAMRLIEDEYDYIFLSNIFDYIFNLPSKMIDEYDEVMVGYKVVLEKVMNKLKDGGTLFYHYVWDAKDNDYEILYQKYLSSFSERIVIPSSNHIASECDNVYTVKNKRRVLAEMHK